MYTSEPRAIVSKAPYSVPLLQQISFSDKHSSLFCDKEKRFNKIDNLKLESVFWFFVSTEKHLDGAKIFDY